MSDGSLSDKFRWWNKYSDVWEERAMRLERQLQEAKNKEPLLTPEQAKPEVDADDALLRTASTNNPMWVFPKEAFDGKNVIDQNNMKVPGDLDVDGDLCVGGNLRVKGEIKASYSSIQQAASQELDDDEIFLTARELDAIRCAITFCTLDGDEMMAGAMGIHHEEVGPVLDEICRKLRDE